MTKDRHVCPKCAQRSTVVQTFSNIASRHERHCCPDGHVWSWEWVAVRRDADRRFVQNYQLVTGTPCE